MSTFLRQTVEGAFRRHGLWGRGALVAVSGGIDSVCLARLVAALGSEGLGPVALAHVDHALRPGSAEDAAFCRDLAAELGLPFRYRRLDPGTRRGNLHAWARAERRAFLRREREAMGLGCVALAHHADDQAETVLFRLLRGAGPRGLGGMAQWAPPFLRPFLAVWRRDLERLATSRGWPWREDPSNRSPRFARARLRHEVLPLLEAVRPGAKAALVRSAALVARDDRVLSAWARDWEGRFGVEEPEGWRLPAADLGNLPDAVRFRVYLAAWARVGADPSLLALGHLEAIDRLLGPKGRPRWASVPGPACVCRSFGDLWFLPERPAARLPALALAGPGARAPAGRFDVVWVADEGAGGPSIAVPPGRGAGGVRLRPRRPGDRLDRAGRTAKVKDVLMGARLPPWRRDQTWVVEDEAGILGLLGPWFSAGPDAGPTRIALADP